MAAPTSTTAPLHVSHVQDLGFPSSRHWGPRGQCIRGNRWTPAGKGRASRSSASNQQNSTTANWDAGRTERRAGPPAAGRKLAVKRGTAARGRDATGAEDAGAAHQLLAEFDGSRDPDTGFYYHARDKAFDAAQRVGYTSQLLDIISTTCASSASRRAASGQRPRVDPTEARRRREACAGWPGASGVLRVSILVACGAAGPAGAPALAPFSVAGVGASIRTRTAASAWAFPCAWRREVITIFNVGA